ncbi:MAG: CBS domain-containing protein [Mariprofundaceae bacterium]|nr:CBS domain-containing protein [Mariprofundaceae bacterium]
MSEGNKNILDDSVLRVTVRDVMKNKFDLVSSKATVREALNTMRHVETKCLIVDKYDDGDEYGIVVIADIAKQVLAKNRCADRMSIYEIMTKPAITVHPDMDIRHASRLFAQVGLTRAPVVDAATREVIGIVSYTDMVMNGLLRLEESCH